jgi:hypothetical protein
MFELTEDIKRIVKVEAVEKDDHGYYVLEVTVIATGNIRKTIRIPHYHADYLRVQIDSLFAIMPDEDRKRSFQNSMAHFAKGK